MFRDGSVVISKTAVFLQTFATLGLVFLLGQTQSLAQRSNSRIERLVSDLEHGRSHTQSEAAEKLLIVDPKGVDANLRKRAARAFREMALDGHSSDKAIAISGLIHWAGKYSIPVLVEIVDTTKLGIDEAVWNALIELEDPRCAEAAASMLGNFFNHDEAVQCLKDMGPIAEPAVINVAKRGTEKAAVTAVEILAEIGTEKSLTTLRRASSRTRGDQKALVRMAMSRIKSRMEGEPEETDEIEVASDPEDPFSGGSLDEYASGGNGGEGDWSETARVLPRGPGIGFTPDPKPSTTEQPKRLRAAVVHYDHMRSHSAQVLTADDKPDLAAYFTCDAFKSGLARLERVSFTRGKATGALPMARDTTSAALSPSGILLVMAAEEGNHSDRLRLEVSDLTSRDPKLVEQWTPYHRDSKMFSTDLLWLKWINDQEFFTLNRTGDLVLWQAKGAKALWEASISYNCIPALSPGRNQIAVSTPDGTALLECATGDTILWSAELKSSTGALGYSLDGTKVACVNGSRVRIWDLNSNRMTRDFHNAELVAPHKQFAQPVSINGSFLIVRGSRSVDVLDIDQRRIIERHTHNARSGAGKGNWTLLACTGSSRAAIIPIEAPSAGLESPAIEDPDSLLALNRGDSVSLDIRVGGGLQNEVREILTEAATKAGLEIDPNAETRFTAQIGRESEVVTYRSFHSAPWDKNATTDVNVQKKTYSVTLFIDGEPAWTYQRYQGTQMHLRGNRGETLQQASDRQTQESANYFRGIQLPNRIVHPKYASPITTYEVPFR